MQDYAIASTIRRLGANRDNERHQAFRDIHAYGSAAVQQLAEAMLGTRNEPSMRFGAALALAQMPEHAAPVVPHLVSALLQPLIGPCAEDALVSIGAASVQTLRKLLQADDAEAAAKAAELLGRIGEDALAALPDLISLLDDPDLLIRRNAASFRRRRVPNASACA